jgi:hypothetical protein
MALLYVDVTGDAAKFEAVNAACLVYINGLAGRKKETLWAKESFLYAGKDWIPLPEGFSHKDGIPLPEIVTETVSIIDIVKKVNEGKEIEARDLERKYREKGGAIFETALTING